MSTLIVGMLMAMSTLQMFRLNSWVISSTVIMLLVSVAVSITTDFHTISQAWSILVLITAVVLLNQPKLRFGDLLALNLLLFIHVLSAYLSDTSATVLLILFISSYLIPALIKRICWQDWLLTLALTTWWVLLGHNWWWVFVVLIYVVYLLNIQYKTLANHTD